MKNKPKKIELNMFTPNVCVTGSWVGKLGKEIYGFIPVYRTRDAAEENYPGSTVYSQIVVRDVS